jgi:hypothetical protein
MTRQSKTTIKSISLPWSRWVTAKQGCFSAYPVRTILGRSHFLTCLVR